MRHVRGMAACLAGLMLLIGGGCEEHQGPAKGSDKVSEAATEDTEDTAEEGKEYTIRIACSNEAWRAENVKRGAEMLNKQLKEEGSGDRVKIQYDMVEDFASSMTLWMREDNLPEIVAQTTNSIFDFAYAGAIIDASDIVNGEVYSREVPQKLRDMGKGVDGKYYGIILDTECRFVVVYKPALQELGWSEDEIETWKQEARQGNITTRDLQNVAKEVVDRGICEYGIMHRPNDGADWQFTFITWNRGEIPLNEDGKIVINRQNIIDYLTFWRECVQMGITPYNHLTDFDWDMLEGDIWPSGDAFCWYGQIAAKSDIMSANSDVTGEYFNENYFSIPLPVSHAGDPPVSGSNPYFYCLTTSSQKDEKVAEYCRRILENLLDPEIQLNTSVYRSHLAITERTKQRPEYKGDAWMADADYLTDYMFNLPHNKYLAMYGGSPEMYDAIQKAELEANDPNADTIEEITDDLIQKMTFNMGEGHYILVDE